jgi:PIN domain nuclease of toxin-antitoxin system
MAYVLDTPAILGFLLDEPGSDQVKAILEGDMTDQTSEQW